MATQSYSERMKAARAEASAQRRRSKQRVNGRSSCAARSTGWRSRGEGWHSGQGPEKAIDVQPG